MHTGSGLDFKVSPAKTVLYRDDFAGNATRDKILNSAVKCTSAASTYMNIPSAVCNPAPSDVLCVSGWFYLTSLSANNFVYLLSTRYDSTAPAYRGFSLSYKGASSIFQAQLYTDNGGVNPVNDVQFSYTGVLNKWHHFVFTKWGLSAATYGFYIDGVALTPVVNLNQLTAGSTVQTGQSPLINNLDIADAGYIANGFFTNYQFYNRLLTQNEITTLYRRPLSSFPNLTAWYQFTERNGQVISESVSANNGNLVGYTAANTATSPNPQSGNTTWYDYFNLNAPITV